MQNDDIPIPRMKKGPKAATKKRMIKTVKAAASEKGSTYGVGRLNLSETVHMEDDFVRGEENVDGHDYE